MDIERGHPPVYIAMNTLAQGLTSARAYRRKIIKVIHGYGSSGIGGSIKTQMNIMLGQKKRLGVIADFIIGEKFSAFDADCRKIIDKYPILTKDCDYNRANPGITIIIMP